MLSPKEILKRRLRGRQNLATEVIQLRNLSSDDNNNSSTTRNSTSQTSENKINRNKQLSCCVAQSSNEEIEQTDDITKYTVIKTKSKKKLDENAYSKVKEKGLTSIKGVIDFTNTILDKVSVISPKHKQKEDSADVSLMEYYEDEIAGENVIINKQYLYSTDDDKEITIVIRDYTTPTDYLKNVEYYRQVNKARETFIRAAALVGDCLQRGEVEGDRDEWIRYLNKAEAEKKIWRKMCDTNHLLRDKDVRYAVTKVGICTRIWKRCVEEYKDIFPCCFPP